MRRSSDELGDLHGQKVLGIETAARRDARAGVGDLVWALYGRSEAQEREEAARAAQAQQRQKHRDVS